MLGAALPAPWSAAAPNAPNLPTASSLEVDAAAAVHRLLASEPNSGVRLLDASLAGERLTLNFSRDLWSLVPGSLPFERFAAKINRAAGDALRDRLDSFEIFTEIERTPLSQFFPLDDRPASPPVARRAAPSPPGVSPVLGALAGRRIAISPGHGYYLLSGTNYVLQRSYFSGIVEDFVNHDIVTYLNALLVEAGAEVRPVRNLDRAAGLGETGFPKWQEAARYHVKALGADPSVWNESGFTALEQDIRCRPRYANAVGADLLVSVHNNGGGGTGTETLYDTNNGYGPESKRLADLLHAKVIAAIRRDYNPAWTDRRVQGFNGSYGENRLATRPAVIMEIAFMDKPTPDNAALQDERFKQLVAAAICDGIREFLDGPAPAAPSALLATSEAGAIALAWRDNATNTANVVIERKTSTTSTWAALATVEAPATSYRDTTATSALTYVYRVRAVGAGGNTAGYSNEATVTAVPSGAPTLALSVDPAVIPALDAGSTVTFVATVTDAAGIPVPGATLEITDGLTGAPVAETVTAPSGRLVFARPIPASQSAGTRSFTFRATRAGHSSSAVVTRAIDVTRPTTPDGSAATIQLHPASRDFAVGSRVVLEVTPAGRPLFSYQWRRNGVALPGATDRTFVLERATAGDAGIYAVTVANSGATVTSADATLRLIPSAWLSNVSLRTTLASGQAVIVGFVSTGAGQDLLVRAAGPSLAAFGLANAMADPRIELYRGATRTSDNNDWPLSLASVFTTLGAFTFPAASRDAAALYFLSGPLTAQITGPTAGTVLIEGYDAGTGGVARLINLSARNRVGTGADILIAGFFVAGTGTQRVLIRAVGPTLAALGVTGVLSDPQLEIIDSTGTRLATNDNWDASLAPVFAQVGAFPLPVGSKDAAVVATLNAGRSYTVQVSGVANTVGEALVEIYEVP